MTKPIGIYGGTFDPIHTAHIQTAREVYDALNLGQIRFIPCQLPVHRDAPHASARDRIAMVNLALSDTPEFICDTRECDRNTPSYMYETLASLREEMGVDQPLCLILGMDAFKHFDSWHRWQEILTLAHLIIMTRPGYRLPEAETLKTWYTAHQTDTQRVLHTTPAGSILTVPVTAFDISATHIRQALAKGAPTADSLPPAVAAYISSHQLYIP